MEKMFRHGDLGLSPVEKLPGDAEKSKTNVLMKGSNDNDHSIDNGQVYFKDENQSVFGYLIAKDTTLFHVDHGEQVPGKKLRKAKIPDGIYALRRQVEDTHEGMRPVVD